MITRLAVIVVFSHVFLVPGLLVVAVGAWIANFYLKAQMSVKRELRQDSSSTFQQRDANGDIQQCQSPRPGSFRSCNRGFKYVPLSSTPSKILIFYLTASIRAYGAQDAFKQESLKRIDFYSRAARVSWNLNRWMAIRIDALGALFTTALAAYLVYGSSTNPVGVGFSLTMAAEFCTTILIWVRLSNHLEVQANR